MAAALNVRAVNAWRPLGVLSAFHLNSWRRLRTLRAWHDGAWRLIGSFAQPVTVSASPPDASGFAFSPSPIFVTSNAVTAVVSGGSPPFTYAWTGGAIATNPTNASTAFGLTLHQETVTTTMACTVTDSLGATATVNVLVTLTAQNMWTPF